MKKKKKSISYTIERVQKNGKTQTIEVHAVYFERNGQGYILSSSVNITERLHLIDKLNESLALYELFTEQTAEAIFCVDLKGKIVYSNKAASKISKIPIPAARGRSFIEFVPERSKKKARMIFQQAMKGTPVILSEMELIDHHGHIVPVEFTTTPIYKDGKIFQIHTIFRDISRRKQLERLQRETDKNKGIQQFISGAAHEIHGPLKGVLENTDKLIDDYKNRDYEYVGFKEFKHIFDTLSTMKKQLKYCYDTNSRLLDLGKKKAGLKMGYCEVNTVIKEVLQSIKHDTDFADIKLKLNLSKKLPVAAIGSVKLNQVALNIITNSVQSIPKNGVIEIRSCVLKEEGMIRITFKDNGEGIPEELISRVYEPFFTTKSRGLDKSSGLGLSIAYAIMRAAKGEISINSSVRKGTTVYIKIPIYRNGKKK